MPSATDLLLCAVLRKSAAIVPRYTPSEALRNDPRATRINTGPLPTGESPPDNPEMVGAGIGALGGGLIGYFMSEKDKNGKRKRPWLNAALGAGGGALLGSGAGATMRAYGDTRQIAAESRHLDDLSQVRGRERQALQSEHDTLASQGVGWGDPRRRDLRAYLANEHDLARELTQRRDRLRHHNPWSSVPRRALTLGLAE
jgi:hypothetical protein